MEKTSKQRAPKAVARKPRTPRPPAAEPAPASLDAVDPADTLTARDTFAPPPAVDENERRRRIAEAAYYRAERRGFTPGGEQDDWLEAEREIDGGDSGRKD